MAQASGTQALSTTAIQLPSVAGNEVSIRNNDASISMLIGVNATTQSYTLPPLTEVSFRLKNLNNLWAKSASGTPTLSYLVV